MRQLTGILVLILFLSGCGLTSACRNDQSKPGTIQNAGPGPRIRAEWGVPDKVERYKSGVESWTYFIKKTETTIVYYFDTTGKLIRVDTGDRKICVKGYEDLFPDITPE